MSDSIKGLERIRRGAGDATRTVISSMDQILPISSEFDKFWACTENKVDLQKFFISWMLETYKGNIPVYLGGCNSEDRFSCIKLVNGQASQIDTLKCFYDEADDRLIYHINHAIKVDHFEKVHVLSNDTDIFVNLMFQFTNWSKYGPLEVWFHLLNKMSPVHEAASNLPINVVHLLPAIHVLTGCDTTSKLGTKLQAYQTAQKPEFAELNQFGIQPLDKKMYNLAERFLLECISRAKERTTDTFDQLRYYKYHTPQFKLDIRKFPCTSGSLKMHILSAYFQCRLWIFASSMKACDLKPELYGYLIDEDEMLVPVVTTGPKYPEDFPFPCTCIKCAKSNVCICRVKEIECCDF